MRRQKSGGEVLSAEALRKIPLQTCAEAAARRIVGWPDSDARNNASSVSSAEIQKFLAAEGLSLGASWASDPDGGGVSTVAAVYIYASALGLPPHVTLQKALHLTKTEASNWVSVARGQNLLPEYRQAKRGPREE